LIVLALSVAGAVAVLYLKAAKPEHPVGFAEFAIGDPQDQPLAVAVWYPTDTSPSLSVVGLSAQMVATNAAVVGRDLPLVVISHGNGGMLSSHADTAVTLASAGFVVAAVTHTGDNARDDRYVGTPRWLTDRPRHIHAVLDYMLTAWPAHAQIDHTRVGIFGFSVGGFSALVSIGGVPELGQIASQCKSQPEFGCTLWKALPASVSATTWIYDARFKAAVIAAPGYGFAFEPDGLSRVKVPVQLWHAVDDLNVPYQTNAGVVRRLLPTPPEYHAVPGAGHFAFLAPCPSWMIPLICKDAEGFDRAAFHRDFNHAVVAFYQKALAVAPK
jgi:predicted dienelactone hydrolase